MPKGSCVAKASHALNRKNYMANSMPYLVHSTSKEGRNSIQRTSLNITHGFKHKASFQRNARAEHFQLYNQDVKPSTKNRKACLQKISIDTFSLPSDDKDLAESHFENVLTSTHSSVHCKDKKHADLARASTSKTTNCQLFSRPETQPTSQALTNKGVTCENPSSSAKSEIIVTTDEMMKYLQLLEEPYIAKFLHFDSCCKVADKYLLAMVFMYFSKAKLTRDEFNQFNFFAALYLANDMEEDFEGYKFEILPWALGKTWRVHHKVLLDRRIELLKKMGYRAVVSKRCCEEIMAIEPDHHVWKRERQAHHAGAIRDWIREEQEDKQLIGPDGSPRSCDLCGYPSKRTGNADTAATISEHDSLSPDRESLSPNHNSQVWLQMDSSGTSLEEYNAVDMTTASTCTFNLADMQKNISGSADKFSSGRGRSLSGYMADDTLDWVDCYSDTEKYSFCDRPEP
ncbi:speedy protein A-like [Watersipora subatra]|uniref:speedy protein A-like n=1 Tax=Watersipora subatra TaxID=2589382 RepID=UPI00355B6F72